jgi:beta-1,4-mannosyltransferase
MITNVVFIPYWGTVNPYQDSLEKSLKPLGVNITKLESFGPGFTQGELNAIIYKIFSRRLKVDILHLHLLPRFKWKLSRLLKLIVFVLQLAVLRILGFKIVWTAHNLNPHESVYPKGDWAIAKITAILANAVIAHGSSAKTKLVSTLNLKNHDKIAVIPHGNFIAQYDNSISRASARSKLGISDSKFVVLFLGRIRPYKGILRLIDAFKTLRQDIPDAELVIAGRPSNEKFSNRIREKIAGCEGLRYKPEFVPQEEIQIYMNASDVTVFPYSDILTSGAAVLAMSFARPCVALNLGFTRDILDDSGAFLYDPAQNDGLLNALKAAYAGRPNLADMGQYNFRKVLPWSWDYVAAETNKVYLKCTYR